MSLLGGVLFAFGVLAIPGWLLVISRRYRYRSTRIRGAFWGGIIGHLCGDALFLGALLDPPLTAPTDGGVGAAMLLVAPPVAGVVLGALIGRQQRAPRLTPTE